MTFRLAVACCTALSVLAAGSTAVAAAPAASARSDSLSLRDAVFARSPRVSAATGDAAAKRFAAGRPEAVEAAGRGRHDAAERGERSDLEALAPRPAMKAGFRLKF